MALIHDLRPMLKKPLRVCCVTAQVGKWSSASLSTAAGYLKQKNQVTDEYAEVDDMF